MAMSEVERSMVAEEREREYLQTVEQINMADIKIERENLKSECEELDIRYA
jgi:hypothetical protein